MKPIRMVAIESTTRPGELSIRAKCGAKGCEREVDGDIICEACSVELEVLMRDEMAKKLGRAPGDAEFDIFLDRLMAACPPSTRTKGSDHG
jgi:hypothetical protein